MDNEFKVMLDKISKYCESIEDDCFGCVIESHCKECNGDFQAYMELAKDACAIIDLYATEDSDHVNHPSHYNQGGIECIDAMIAAYGKDAVKTFCVCNAFKYLWRYDHKNQAEDIEKAAWYIHKWKELSANEEVDNLKER